MESPVNMVRMATFILNIHLSKWGMGRNGLLLRPIPKWLLVTVTNAVLEEIQLAF